MTHIWEIEERQEGTTLSFYHLSKTTVNVLRQFFGSLFLLVFFIVYIIIQHIPFSLMLNIDFVL